MKKLIILPFLLLVNCSGCNQNQKNTVSKYINKENTCKLAKTTLEITCDTEAKVKKSLLSKENICKLAKAILNGACK